MNWTYAKPLPNWVSLSLIIRTRLTQVRGLCSVDSAGVGGSPRSVFSRDSKKARRSPSSDVNSKLPTNSVHFGSESLGAGMSASSAARWSSPSRGFSPTESTRMMRSRNRLPSAFFTASFAAMKGSMAGSRGGRLLGLESGGTGYANTMYACTVSAVLWNS